MAAPDVRAPPSWSLSFVGLARRAAGRPVRQAECLPEQLAVQFAELARIGGKRLAGLLRKFSLRFHGLFQRAGGRKFLGKRLRVFQRLPGVVAIGVSDRLNAADGG